MSLTIVNKRCPEETNSDYAYRLIRRNIMNLYLKPGAVLNEAELSDQLGMSRTPIREALILLKNEGLVDIMPQRGSRVSHISLSLVREGYFMRRILETAIIREIAGALSSEQTAALKANLELQRQELARYVDKLSDDFFDLDDDMHRMLYEFSNRNHIWSALHGVNSHYDRVRYLDTVVNDVDQSAILENHSTLYCYLLMGIPGWISRIQSHPIRIILWIDDRHVFNKYISYGILSPSHTAARRSAESMCTFPAVSLCHLYTVFILYLYLFFHPLKYVHFFTFFYFFFVRYLLFPLFFTIFF